MRARTLLAVLFLGAFGALPATAGDGVTDAARLDHRPRFDRTPVCPVDHEPFNVRLLGAPGDLDGVRVRMVDAPGAWVGAVRTPGATRDAWSATLPAALGARIHYYFELTDGPTVSYLGPIGRSLAPPADSGWVVDFGTLEHAPYGATEVSGGGVVFRVWAPSNAAAIAQGEFNGWASSTLMGHVDGDFIARLPAAHVGQQYKFQFSNGYWNPDPYSTGLRDDTYGGLNSLVDTTAYAWQDGAFEAPANDRLVIYALDTECFAGLDDPAGAAGYPSTFADLRARLGHLQELGVNALLLSPVTETSNYYRYGGYQPLSQYAVEASLGSANALRAVVDAAHARGMAVLFDLVWTHQAFYDDFLWQYGGFQNWYPTPSVSGYWGPQMDYSRDEVRDYYLESALRWIEEFHADGLRLYGVPYMVAGPQPVAATALLRDLATALHRRGRPGLTLADVWSRDASVTAPVVAGGLGFGAQADHQLAAVLASALPLAGGGDPYVTGLAGALLDGGPGLGAGALHRFVEMRHESWMSTERLAASLARPNGIDDPDAQARMRLAMGLVMTAPGVPGVLMGDEWLERNTLNDDATGRIDWANKSAHREFFDFVSAAVHLRASEDALRAGAAMELVRVDESANVLVFRRHDAGREVLVAANLGASDQPALRLGVPVAGTWRERLDSADPAWGGEGPVNPGDLATEAVAADGQPQSLVIALPRLAFAVLGPMGSLGVPGAPGAARLALARVGPNPVAGAAWAEVTLPRAGTLTLDLYDIGGRRMARVADAALGAGTHRVAWDSARLRLAPGLYVLAAECAGERATRKVALLR